MRPVRVGLMGFGQVGRQIYRLALDDRQFQIPAVSDIGRPDILHHLLTRPGGVTDARLEGNNLVAGNGALRTRLMPADRPAEIPWDLFSVDLVIDTTGRYRSAEALRPHLDNGAPRVVISTLPTQAGGLDRVLVGGVNDDQAHRDDRLISAGSASTAALALALKVMGRAGVIEHAAMTSVHAYTSDQSLQDYAGADYRRSRSGAKNIIPNETPAVEWVQRIMPRYQGKISGFALNVPVQAGSMLDLTVAYADESPSLTKLVDLFQEAESTQPDIIATTRDPIVSSDVRGCSASMLIDLKGLMRAGERLVKLLAWHETLGHARRMLDLAGRYATLDAGDNAEDAA